MSEQLEFGKFKKKLKEKSTRGNRVWRMRVKHTTHPWTYFYSIAGESYVYSLERAATSCRAMLSHIGGVDTTDTYREELIDAITNTLQALETASLSEHCVEHVLYSSLTLRSLKHLPIEQQMLEASVKEVQKWVNYRKKSGTKIKTNASLMRVWNPNFYNLTTQ